MQIQLRVHRAHDFSMSLDHFGAGPIRWCNASLAQEGSRWSRSRVVTRHIHILGPCIQQKLSRAVTASKKSNSKQEPGFHFHRPLQGHVGSLKMQWRGGKRPGSIQLKPKVQSMGATRASDSLICTLSCSTLKSELPRHPLSCLQGAQGHSRDDPFLTHRVPSLYRHNA